MPESPSFIPKRNPGQPRRPAGKYNLFFLTIVSYSLFAAAPLASAALFIYQKHTNNQFTMAVTNLDEAISVFKQSDLDRVLVFDERLETAKKLMNNHVSVVSLLKILELSTANTVQFENLDIERTQQKTILVKAKLTTPSLDGVLFQRAVYNNNATISSTTLSNVKLVDLTSTSSENVNTSAKKLVKLDAEFSFSADKISYQPLSYTETVEPSLSQNIIDETVATSSDIINDANNINN